jgi:hypothetical protein
MATKKMQLLDQMVIELTNKNKTEVSRDARAMVCRASKLQPGE